MAKRLITLEEYKAKLNKKSEKKKAFANAFLKSSALFTACALTLSLTAIANARLIAVNAVSHSITSDDDFNAVGNETLDNDRDDENNSSDNNDVNESPTENGETETKNPNNSQDNNKAPTNPTQDKLSTNEEKYQYFLTSFNNVKTKAKTTTNYWRKGSNYKNLINVGNSKIVSAAAQSLTSKFLVEETPKDAVYSGADIAANFPPAGVKSNLNMTDIKKITCREDGDYYIITIYCKDEVNPSAGKGVGAVGSIITKEEILEPISSIPMLRNMDPVCAYENVHCEAKIEKSTGNMVHYYVSLPLILSAEGSEYFIGLEFEEKWDIKY